MSSNNYYMKLLVTNYIKQPCDIEFAKSTLAQIDADDWNTNRYNSEKLRYYNLYKFDNNRAEYTSMNISKYQRSLFAQFRCGILPLEIEVGRFRDIPLSDRTCKICDSGLVEDEIHFTIKCPTYIAIRKSFENILNTSRPINNIKGRELHPITSKTKDIQPGSCLHRQTL